MTRVWCSASPAKEYFHLSCAGLSLVSIGVACNVVFFCYKCSCSPPIIITWPEMLSYFTNQAMFLNDAEFPVLKSLEVGSQKPEGHKLKSCVERLQEMCMHFEFGRCFVSLWWWNAASTSRKTPPSPPDFLPPPPSMSPEPLQVSSEIIGKFVHSHLVLLLAQTN